MFEADNAQRKLGNHWQKHCHSLLHLEQPRRGRSAMLPTPEPTGNANELASTEPTTVLQKVAESQLSKTETDVNGVKLDSIRSDCTVNPPAVQCKLNLFFSVASIHTQQKEPEVWA